MNFDLAEPEWLQDAVPHGTHTEPTQKALAAGVLLASVDICITDVQVILIFLVTFLSSRNTLLVATTI